MEERQEDTKSVEYALGLLQFNSNPVSKQVSEPKGKKGPVPREFPSSDQNVVQRCYKCKQNKPLTAYCSDRSRPNGRSSKCKECNRAHVKRYAQSPKGRARFRRYFLARVYGITQERYEEMVREQDGRCAICKLPISETQRKQFYIDHNHATGQVRGLLCGTCNSGIGLFRESRETMKSAMEYLEKWDSKAV